MRSASRLCSRTNRVCTAVRLTCSLARTSPARNSRSPRPNGSALGRPAVFSGSSWPSALVFSLPPWNVRRAAARAGSEPYTIEASMYDVMLLTTSRRLSRGGAGDRVGVPVAGSNSERLNGIGLGPSGSFGSSIGMRKSPTAPVGQGVELRPVAGQVQVVGDPLAPLEGPVGQVPVAGDAAGLGVDGVADRAGVGPLRGGDDGVAEPVGELGAVAEADLPGLGRPLGREGEVVVRCRRWCATRRRSGPGPTGTRRSSSGATAGAQCVSWPWSGPFVSGCGLERDRASGGAGSRRSAESALSRARAGRVPA